MGNDIRVGLGLPDLTRFGRISNDLCDRESGISLVTPIAIVTLHQSRVHRPSFRRAASARAVAVRTASALVLLLLIALPFTAPFSTCNIGMFVGDSHTALQLTRPLSMTPAVDLRSDTSGSVLDEESFKDVTVASPEVGRFVVSALASTPWSLPATSAVRAPLVALRL